MRYQSRVSEIANPYDLTHLSATKAALILVVIIASPTFSLTLPVIDFSGKSGTKPALPALAVASTSKPWLKDYLNNAGQVAKTSPNLGLRVTVPMGASSPAGGRA